MVSMRVRPGPNSRCLASCGTQSLPASSRARRPPWLSSSTPPLDADAAGGLVAIIARTPGEPTTENFHTEVSSPIPRSQARCTGCPASGSISAMRPSARTAAISWA